MSRVDLARSTHAPCRHAVRARVPAGHGRARRRLCVRQGPQPMSAYAGDPQPGRVHGRGDAAGRARRPGPGDALVPGQRPDGRRVAGCEPGSARDGASCGTADAARRRGMDLRERGDPRCTRAQRRTSARRTRGLGRDGSGDVQGRRGHVRRRGSRRRTRRGAPNRARAEGSSQLRLRRRRCGLSIAGRGRDGVRAGPPTPPRSRARTCPARTARRCSRRRRYRSSRRPARTAGPASSASRRRSG